MAPQLRRFLLAVTCFVAVQATTYTATCSFTNMDPFSPGAYVTTADGSTSDVCAYGNTTYFDCSNGTQQHVDVWDAAGDMVITNQSLNQEFSCQARNALYLAPATYANRTGTFGGFVSPTEIPSGQCQAWFANFGYDGGAFFYFTIDGTNYAPLTRVFYGQAAVIATSCTARIFGTSKVAAHSGYPRTDSNLLAEGSFETLTDYHEQTHTGHYLVGTSGSNRMLNVEGCESTVDNCMCTADAVTQAPTTLAGSGSGSGSGSGAGAGSGSGSAPSICDSLAACDGEDPGAVGLSAACYQAAGDVIQSGQAPPSWAVCNNAQQATVSTACQEEICSALAACPGSFTCADVSGSPTTPDSTSPDSTIDSTTFTCGEIKAAYKTESCCGNPTGTFTIPSSSRRLLTTASEPQVISDQVIEKFTNWNNLLDQGVISAQEYSTRKNRLLESLMV